MQSRQVEKYMDNSALNSDLDEYAYDCGNDKTKGLYVNPEDHDNVYDEDNMKKVIVTQENAMDSQGAYYEGISAPSNNNWTNIPFAYLR